MAPCDKIEQTIDPGLEMRLASFELPQLLAPRLDRLEGEIEPAREEIAKSLGNEEALLDRLEDDVVELRPSDATALSDARASSCSVGAAIILVPSTLAGDCRHAAAAAISTAATASETDEKIVRGRYARGLNRRSSLDETALYRFEIISRDDRRNRNGNPLTLRTPFTRFGIALIV